MKKKYRLLTKGEIVLPTDSFSWHKNLDITNDSHWNSMWWDDSSIGKPWSNAIAPMRREVILNHPVDVF